MGGVETHVLEVAKRLPAYGVTSEVATADETWELPEHDLVDGVPVTRLRAYPRRRDWMYAPGLRRVIAGGRWDVIHVQSYHTFVAPVAMRAARRAGVPYALTFHGGGSSSRPRTAVRGIQMRLLGPSLRWAATLVAIADFEIREYGALIGAGPSRFTKIPNGADLPPNVPAVRGDAPLLVSLGRLERYKGHARVLAAFPFVRLRVPDARLWIAGAGPEEEALRAQAAELGLADRVEIGVADRRTLTARLGGAAAMVLLSEFESHPISVLEAASLGVPAVVAANSGMLELAEQGLARAVSLDAPPEMHAQAIVEAMQGPRPAPRTDVPTWDDCARRLAELYRSVHSGA